MAQISRPYQIALLALAVAVVAFLALGRHPSSSSSSATTTASAPAPAVSATHTAATPTASSKAGLGAAEEKAAAAPTPIYHGSAPGLKGLSRAIARAHGAVATSQANAKQLEEKAAQASAAPSAAASASPSTASKPHSTATSKASPSTTAKAPASASTSTSTSATSTSSPPAAAKGADASPGAVPSRQRAVEGTLAHGKVAVLLFWNPAGADDVAVHRQVQQLGKRRLAINVYDSSAEEVAAFGAITRQVPVYGTPTILVIATDGHTTLLTGLQDAFSIEQAIEQARSS